MSAPPTGWLADQLPEALSSRPFTRNFLAGFEDIAGGLRARVEGVRHHLDLRLAPAEDLGWLASWLAQTVDGLPADRQREVIAIAGRELPWRGTARWLRALVAAYTGADPDAVEVTDTGGVYLPGRWRPHLRTVTVRLADTGGLSRRQLERLIRGELPVDADLDLRLPGDGEPDGSPPGPSAPPEPAQEQAPEEDDGEWLPPDTGPLRASPSSPDDEPFSVRIRCDAATVARDRPLRCWLYVHNSSDQPARFTVVGAGEAAEWIADAPLTVSVAAGHEQGVPIDVVAPPDVGLRTGRYSIGVRVTSSLPGGGPETRWLTLNLVD